MPISEVEKLLIKFKKVEDTTDNYKMNEHDVKNIVDKDAVILREKLNFKTVQEAKERNKLVLKNLETAKGNLRSKAIFSPSEIQWKKLYNMYQSEPALVVCKWKCHMPVFV